MSERKWALAEIEKVFDKNQKIDCSIIWDDFVQGLNALPEPAESAPFAPPDEKKLILKPRFSCGPNGDLFAGYNQVGGDVFLDDDEVEYVVYYRGSKKKL